MMSDADIKEALDATEDQLKELSAGLDLTDNERAAAVYLAGETIKLARVGFAKYAAKHESGELPPIRPRSINAGIAFALAIANYCRSKSEGD